MTFARRTKPSSNEVPLFNLTRRNAKGPRASSETGRLGIEIPDEDDAVYPKVTVIPQMLRLVFIIETVIIHSQVLSLDQLGALYAEG